MSTALIAEQLVTSIVNTEIKHWAKTNETAAFKAAQACWAQNSASIPDKNDLRQEILKYYNGLETNENRINLSEMETRAFFSKILTSVLGIPIRLDFYDVSELGRIILGLILGVLFFGRNAVYGLITEKFQEYKENDVNAAVLAQSILHHFDEHIIRLSRQEIDTIKATDILVSTNQIFYRFFGTKLDLKFTEHSAPESDSAIRQLAERLEKLGP